MQFHSPSGEQADPAACAPDAAVEELEAPEAPDEEAEEAGAAAGVGEAVAGVTMAGTAVVEVTAAKTPGEFPEEEVAAAAAAAEDELPPPDPELLEPAEDPTPTPHPLPTGLASVALSLSTELPGLGNSMSVLSGVAQSLRPMLAMNISGKLLKAFWFLSMS